MNFSLPFGIRISIEWNAALAFNKVCKQRSEGGPVYESTADILRKRKENRLDLQREVGQRLVRRDFEKTGESKKDVEDILNIIDAACERLKELALTSDISERSEGQLLETSWEKQFSIHSSKNPRKSLTIRTFASSNFDWDPEAVDINSMSESILQFFVYPRNDLRYRVASCKDWAKGLKKSMDEWDRRESERIKNRANPAPPDSNIRIPN
jgi:hypothetical protein